MEPHKDGWQGDGSPSESTLRALAEQTASGLLVVSDDGTIRYAGSSTEVLLGHPPRDMASTNVFALVHAEDVERLRLAIAAVGPREGDTSYEEFRVAAPTGGWRWVGASIRNCTADPQIGGLLLHLHDVTRRKQLDENAVLQQVMYDRLTGLPSRPLLQDLLERACLVAAREREPLAVLLINIDRFKDVNVALGHTLGDAVLAMVAQRLRATLRVSDTFARLIGDEFVALLRDSDEVSALNVAERVAAAFEEPFLIDRNRIALSASMGIALYPMHGKDGEELLRHADVAVQNAREMHLPCAVYRSEDDGRTVRRLAMRAELREAIEQNRLVQYYQPKRTLRTGRIEEVEALARWAHPSQGFVPPSEFIHLAERWNAIKPLTIWALRTAINEAETWSAAGLPLTVSVNLSTRDLHGQDLVPAVSELLGGAGLDPHALILEVTESTLMVDPDNARYVLGQLQALGVGISVDDFGTGYSSLSYLSRLPLDELKIDSSFVAGMRRTDRERLVVATTIDLGHRLGLTVTAEGVEDEATAGTLAEMGCDKVQGYYVSRPVPSEELMRWLRETATS
ncbi:MAG TPA: EAL domain-containing protein [Chloroflexota bacterium]|nr:EAL domain-containing protein [Chloroflexota bacterium]